jgi:hypothetical protein
MAEASITEYYISDYRCPGCNRPAERVGHNKNKNHIGVIHKDDCWFFRQLREKFPELIAGIARQREKVA